jgi:hypothetical protein
MGFQPLLSMYIVVQKHLLLEFNHLVIVGQGIF